MKSISAIHPAIMENTKDSLVKCPPHILIRESQIAPQFAITPQFAIKPQFQHCQACFIWKVSHFHTQFLWKIFLHHQ